MINILFFIKYRKYLFNIRGNDHASYLINVSSKTKNATSFYYCSSSEKVTDVILRNTVQPVDDLKKLDWGGLVYW